MNSPQKQDGAATPKRGASSADQGRVASMDVARQEEGRLALIQQVCFYPAAGQLLSVDALTFP